MLVTPDPTSRRGLALRAGVLAGVGAIYIVLLTFNKGDNAYLGLVIFGALLVLAAIPFALALLLPAGRARRIATRVGVCGVWLIGAYVALGLGQSLLAIGQSYSGAQQQQLFVSHALAVLLLGVAIFVGAGGRLR